LKNRELKSLASVILERNRKKRLEQGHPWVYASEVASVDGEPEAGGLVDVLNHQGRFLAVGYYNPASQIRVRIVSQGPLAAMDTAFFVERLQINSMATPLLAAALSLWAAAVIAGELPPTSRAAALCNTISQPLQFISLAVSGFALVLWGIAVMQSIGGILQESGLFLWFLNHASTSALWGLAAGACLTALLHSSAAVIAMAMSIAASGAMPPELGIAIVLGANVGTCVTAVIASIGGSPSGVFVAWSHVALNVGGALIFLPLIGPLQATAAWIGGGPASQIAHAQTIFNVVCSLGALPLCYLPIW